VQDVKGRQFVGPLQQGQNAHGSTCLFAYICEGRNYCLDLARELSNIIRILNHYLGDDTDEGAYDGLRDNAFDT
jgi:hypothetical protein